MRPYNDHIPLLQGDTPLHKVPRLWLQLIEPKIVRGKMPIPSCWLWADDAGPFDCDQNGEPRIRMMVDGKRTQHLCKFVVAKMFWKGIECGTPNSPHFIYHHCGTMNCLNPNHFLVCFDHPSQLNLDLLVRERRSRLRDWTSRKRYERVYGDVG